MKVYDERLLEKTIGLLNEKPRSVSQLAEELKRHPRTIKRWLSELCSRGHRVVRDGMKPNDPYYIAPAPPEHEEPEPPLAA